jgi:NADP-dependent 3-hydroxy acid dehydrogenase YdfG
MVKQTVSMFGRLDAAYNNAGIQNVLAETADSRRDDYDRVMREQGSGAIVNCFSLGGLIGGNQRGT